MNKIICNDNLKILKEMNNESVDLIVIDPPFFNKKENQIMWGDQEEIHMYKKRNKGNINIYIKDLEIRLKEMHRVLKSTGSIYLHTDDSTNAYIRILLDEIFGYDNFRNNIIWHYISASESKSSFGKKHDNIFVYSKSKKNIFNMLRVPHSKNTKSKRIYKQNDKEYICNTNIKGKAMDDVWNIPIIPASSKERLQNNGQKPIKLLERIIEVSSNKEDVILDCYMGTGTSLEAALNLNRQFIGIDVAPTACNVAAKRLNYKGKILTSFEEDYRDMDYNEYHDWICNKMNGKYSKDDDCINCILDDNSLVMIKELKTNITPTMVRILISKVYEKDTRNGFIIAPSFSNSVKKLVKEINNKGDLQINLLTPEEL